MKVLLDTNIIIHRENKDPSREDIGKLFWWIDKLGYQKFVSQITVDEISKHQNEATKKAFLTKMQSYNLLPTKAPLKVEVVTVSKKYDANQNDLNDTGLLNEVYSDRADFLISEDLKIHRKADALGLAARVFTIDSFLEKVTTENPALLDYKIPLIKKEYFGNIDSTDNFFDSFKEDYSDFDKWFNKKSDEFAYVSLADGKIIAFLYVKREDESEPYPDINPQFIRKKRLKVGSFKVQLNGFRLGERFLKIIFDNALNLSVDELYVTLFKKRSEQNRLINLLSEYGFNHYGIKKTASGTEEVYTRNYSNTVSIDSPKLTYPFVSRKARKFIVPIYPEYHTSLFPDSILRTESPVDFVENEPFRNAISKVYVSRSIRRDLHAGDIIVFYRTGGFYKGVVTTLGLVDGIHTSITSLQQFKDLCRKRSVFTDKELDAHWNYSAYNRPFVVDFLYAYSFPKRINLKRLIELGVIKDISSVPRGFEEISNCSFERIIEETESNESIIVD